MKKIITSLAVVSLFTMTAHAAAPDSLRNRNINEVIVTGSNQAINRNLLPYSVSVISHKQLEATGKTQLLSAISGEVPSLFVSERNIFGFGVSKGGSGGIKIRGIGSSPTNAILMMVDGQPQFAGLYSHPVADFYETEYVEHVEVLRGPASVLYGSNAMGGVINVITRQPQRDGYHATLTSQYGSYNTWQNALTTTNRQGKFTSVMSLGYDKTDGVQSGLDFKQYSAYKKVGYEFSDFWKGSADFSIMQFIGNDPIYPRLTNSESTDIYHQNVVRGETSLTLSNKYAKTNGAMRIYYSWGNHYVDDPKHFHSLDDRAGILLYQNIQPWKNASATLGFDFATYSGSIPVSDSKEHTPGSMSTMGHESITEFSPYVTLSQNLFNNILTLNGGIRMANSDRFGTHWIPQAGFAVRPAEGWTIKGSLAKGYRNPSFKELYLYKMANRDLKAENMMNYEVTIGKHFSQYLTADLTGYFSEGKDMIQVINSKNVNTGRFINKGIELSLNSNPINNLTLRGSYSYLYTTLSNLTGAPRSQYFLGASWQPISRLSVDLQGRYTSHLYVSDKTDLQNYALLDLKLAYKILDCLEVFSTLNNITDSKYTINEGYKMPGFTAMGGVKLKL